MKAVGWLVADAAGLHFPNWDRHNSKSAKERAMDQARHFQRRNRDATGTRSGLLPNKTTQTRQTDNTDKDLPAAPVAPKKPRSEKQVERDGLWDAVVAEWSLSVATSTQQSRVGKLVGEFKGAGATPSGIGVRRRAIAAAWGPEKATPESTAKHWGEFCPAEAPADVRRAAVEAEGEKFLRESRAHDAMVLAERAAKKQPQGP